MSLIANGVAVPDTERVREAISFRPGSNRNTRKKRGAWDGVGLHWTGGENPWTTVRRTLESRELSVHFVVDLTEIVQLADLATRCAHIGTPGNERFLAIEVRCRGYATKADLEAARLADPTLRERDELDWAVPRDTYADTIGGRVVHMASFAPEQVELLVWLCETLAGVCDFPRALPARRATLDDAAAPPFLGGSELLVTDAAGATWLPALDRDPRKRGGLASTHRGALGHFQVHPTKHDPGSQVLYALWAEGWNPAGAKVPGVVTLPRLGLAG